MPSAMAASRPLWLSLEREDDGWGADATGDNGWSLIVTLVAAFEGCQLGLECILDLPRIGCRQGVLGAKIRCAQWRRRQLRQLSLSSATSCSRNAADASAPRTGFAGFEAAFLRRLIVPGMLLAAVQPAMLIRRWLRSCRLPAPSEP